MILIVPITLLAASLAGGLALWSQTERLVASAYARHVDLGYRAESAAEDVVAGLAQQADWTQVPSTWTPWPVPSAAALDQRTADLNREAAERYRLDGTPRWRLVRVDTSFRTAVWIADDVMDGDGDAWLDGNGVVMIHAEAWAPQGSRRAVEMHVRWRPGGPERRAWREVSW
jgi:hypothetical protein